MNIYIRACTRRARLLQFAVSVSSSLFTKPVEKRPENKLKHQLRLVSLVGRLGRLYVILKGKGVEVGKERKGQSAVAGNKVLLHMQTVLLLNFNCTDAHPFVVLKGCNTL
jgi:hypothetical protein